MSSPLPDPVVARTPSIRERSSNARVPVNTVDTTVVNCWHLYEKEFESGRTD